MKYYFYWRSGSRGPSCAISHGQDPRDRTGDRSLGPQILKGAVHEIPPGPLCDAVEAGGAPWKALEEMFPAPVEEES